MSTLNMQTLSKNPYEQFKIWHVEATNDSRLDNVETNGMYLATATSQGLPSNRVVMLKKFDYDGFIFLTSYASRKAEEMDANPHAAANFYWHPLQRVVRVEGRVERLSQEEATMFFYAMPVAHQIGILASDMRAVISDGEAFEEGIEAMKKEFGDGLNPVPKPDYAGGYRLIASKVEFHEGSRESGSWVRYRFTIGGEENGDRVGPNGWLVERISP